MSPGDPARPRTEPPRETRSQQAEPGPTPEATQEPSRPRGRGEPALGVDAASGRGEPVETSAEATEPDTPRELLTLERIRDDPELSMFISAADRVMNGLGYTEHGFRHANLTGRIAFNVMRRLGFDEHTANLAHVSGYLHDVGNMVAREMHGQTGAVLIYNVLRKEVPPEDLATIMSAVANHEEDDGASVGPVAAAVILADKSDVHRSRVRKRAQLEFDIHDRVNYAAEQSFLRVDSDARTVTLELTIDTEISHVMEYFEIFLGRMVMCRRAADVLDCRFHLNINGAELL